MNNSNNRSNVREGTLKGGPHYLAEGSGPSLVMFNTVTPSYKNPTGVARWAARRFIRPLTQKFTVYMIGRRPGLSIGTTMADIAADYPELVHKLALAATAYRLGPIGRDVQRRYAALLASGDSQRAFMSLAPAITDSRIGQWFWGGFLWLFASLTRIEDPSGMVAMLMAEDAFDLGNRLNEITAPTLLIGGDRDCNYSPDLMKQTAERIQHARLIMYQGRRHSETLTDRRFYRDTIAFLTDEHAI